MKVAPCIAIAFALSLSPAFALSQQPQQNEPVATAQTPTEKALTDEAISEASRNALEERVLISKLAVVKAQSDILKAQVDAVKSQKQLNAESSKNGLSPSSATSGENTIGEDHTQHVADGRPAIPSMSVSWIAGSDSKLQAQIKIAGYGQVVLSKGGIVPASGGLVVETISTTGVILKDPVKTAFYSVPFGGSKM